MKKWLRWAAAGSAAAAWLAPVAARADSGGLLFGTDARALAMGGAHIALDDRAVDAVANPAVLGGAHGLHIAFPQFGVDQYEGPSLSDIMNRIGDLTKNTTGSEDYTNIVKLIFDRPGTSNIAASARLQLGVGPILVSGVGQGNIVGFQIPPFDRNGTNLSNTYGLVGGYAYGPVVSAGIRIPNPVPIFRGVPLRMGANFKFLQGRALFRSFHVSQFNGSEIPVPQPAGKDPASKRSFGLDLGFLLNPIQRLTWGLTIQNAVKPSLPGIREAAVVGTGIAFHAPGHITLAADLSNLTSAYGESAAFRAGAEWRPFGLFALRAGFSNHGPAFGAKILGYDIAYSAASQQIQANILHVNM